MSDIDFFKNFAEELGNLDERDFTKGFRKNKTRLSQTDKDARTVSRVDNALDGKPFDETDTPEGELETVEEDMIDELINRELDNLMDM